MLEAHGLHVVFADNGVAGSPRAGAQRRHRAGADGRDDARAGRQRDHRRDPQPDRYADLPIIAVTAKAMKEDRAKSLASGANDYVTKPVDTDLLLTLIYSHLHNPTDTPEHARSTAR